MSIGTRLMKMGLLRNNAITVEEVENASSVEEGIIKRECCDRAERMSSHTY